MRNFSGPIEEKIGEATEGRASRVKCSEALLEWGGWGGGVGGGCGGGCGLVKIL